MSSRRTLVLGVGVLLAACASEGARPERSASTASGGAGGSATSATSAGGTTSSIGGGGTVASGGSSNAGGMGAGGLGPGGAGGGTTGRGVKMPAGWLYTEAGSSTIFLSDGAKGSPWMARGVNADDLFLCGYNYGLWMQSPSGESALLSVASTLLAEWKPTLVRISLAMNSYTPVVSWSAASAYATSMTNVVNAIGAHPGTYVLVTLRSDATMVDAQGKECGHVDDAVCLPSPATDAVYEALVESFAKAPFVLFGLSNEPGGNASSDQDIAARMDHAVATIRAKEDALGVPHHLVAVQGNQWTSRLGHYVQAPIARDNVVYEYHAYPPDPDGPNGYTQAGLPVIIGEYGPLNGDLSFVDAFHADVEAKGIPNVAWTVAPYSPCQPDLVEVTKSSTLTPTAWGAKVKAYLTAH